MAVALFGCFFLTISSSVALAEVPASISGYVYLDANKDNSRGVGDYAIQFAKLTLTRSDDPTFSVQAITDATGFYKFADLVPSSSATFTLTEMTYTDTDGFDNVGQLYDSTNTLVDSSQWGTAHNTTGDPLKNSITGISLQSGYTGLNYDFGEYTYPLELVSKRMFMDLGPPDPVPEPVSLTLLAAGSCAVGWVVFLRRRRGSS